MDPRKIYRAPRHAGEGITVDADWDKPAWRNVPILSLDHFMGEKPSHRPCVQARAAWDDENLYVIWHVTDRYVLARRTDHQQPVCLDSCVELFFTPGGTCEDNGYFNLEINCCGVMWFAYHPPGKADIMLPPADLAQVEVAPSLSGPIPDEITEPTVWTLEYRLPLSLLRKYAHIAEPQPGATWRANFYKCADETSGPHWLTWSPVEWPAPAFHIPNQFGTLVFE